MYIPTLLPIDASLLKNLLTLNSVALIILLVVAELLPDNQHRTARLYLIYPSIAILLIVAVFSAVLQFSHKI